MMIINDEDTYQGNRRPEQGTSQNTQAGQRTIYEQSRTGLREYLVGFNGPPFLEIGSMQPAVAGGAPYIFSEVLLPCSQSG
jgi:hypothetical protein